MGSYTERKAQLIEQIKVMDERIAKATAKKQECEEKLRKISPLARAEEYNCKPRDLDEIITSEHDLLMKLRSSGLSDSDLLELVGVKPPDADKPSDDKRSPDSKSVTTVREYAVPDAAKNADSDVADGQLSFDDEQSHSYAE